jgi:hypothetical protein
MKQLLNYIITILLLFSAGACTDVLDQKDHTDFSNQIIWEDIDLTKAYLGHCYDMIGGHTSYGLGMREDLLASCTDELWNVHRPYNMTFLKSNLRPDFLGYFATTTYGGFLNWNALYCNIQNVNLFIANIDKVPGATTADEALKTRMKGEAYFIRAYDYAQLLYGYGGVILTDRPFELRDDFGSVNRSSLKRTRDFILSDIEKAIEYLPGKGEIEQGRATQGAAAALKSRLQLFCASDLVNGGYFPEDTLVSFTDGTQTERWQAARDAAKAVIDGTYGTYALAGTTDDPPSPLTESDIKTYSDNYYNIFNQKGAWNYETIWGIQYPETGGKQNRANLWYGPLGYHYWGNNEPTEPAVRSFEMADGTPFQWDVYNPGDQYLRTSTAEELAADPDRNPYNGREPRFYASVLYHGARWQLRPADVAALDPVGIIQTGHFYDIDGKIIASGLDTRQGLISIWSITVNGYYLRKFMDNDLPATANIWGGGASNNTNTWVEFRYAEILLNYAEACIEMGGVDLQNGLDALNMVRNRAGLPDRITSDQSEAREFIRHERAIEFFAEGYRWYDIRRWMIAESVVENVCQMRIKEFENGNMEWRLEPTYVCDQRTFITKNYWLPIPAAEITKAPQLRNNPDY